MKIALFITLCLISFTAHAETGTYKACAGSQCTEFDAEFYTAAQIKAKKPEYFCMTYLKAPPMNKDGKLTLHLAYMLVQDCKKRDNMAQNEIWDYNNPKLEN